ncbi:MAG: hypothetical protein FD127_4474 [Acidimicrobiaceae bacterium]|nr:MAG: hypothetical protein FD127_4474 [Acidimicrobiaceae bacterium]
MAGVEAAQAVAEVVEVGAAELPVGEGPGEAGCGLGGAGALDDPLGVAQADPGCFGEDLFGYRDQGFQCLRAHQALRLAPCRQSGQRAERGDDQVAVDTIGLHAMDTIHQ